MNLLGFIACSLIVIGVFSYLAAYCVDEILYLNELEEEEEA